MDNLPSANPPGVIAFGRVLLTVAAVIALVLMSSPVFAQEPIKTPDRVMLDEPMDWMFSAVYLPHRDEIVVTNPKTKSLLGIGTNGKLRWRQGADSSWLGRDARFPDTITPSPAALAIEGKEFVNVSNGNLQWLDASFAALGKPVASGKKESETEFTIRSYSDHLVTDSGWIVGYGSVAAKGSQIPLYGFIAQSVRELGGPDDSIHLVHPLTSSELYYRLMNRYIATIGNSFYFVALERTPRLYRVELGEGNLSARPLSGMPFSQPTPRFRERDYGYTAVEVYGALEGFDGLPSGLASQGGKLFVLYSPADEGEPWEIVALKPKSNRVEVTGRFCLESDAEHLTMVPSPEHWVMFERGPVFRPDQGQGPVSQTIESFIRLESEALQEEYSSAAIRSSCGQQSSSSPTAAQVARR